MILGNPGSGKSTLARRLGRKLGLPVIHLDREYWLPGWKEPRPADWIDRCRKLASGPRWIMDGNYIATLPDRLARADTVVLLDFPTWLVMARIVRRTLSRLGRRRPDMAEGCPERIDLRFWKFVLDWRRSSLARTEAVVAAAGLQPVRLHSAREAEDWLASLG